MFYRLASGEFSSLFSALIGYSYFAGGWFGVRGQCPGAVRGRPGPSGGSSGALPGASRGLPGAPQVWAALLPGSERRRWCWVGWNGCVSTLSTTSFCFMRRLEPHPAPRILLNDNPHPLQLLLCDVKGSISSQLHGSIKFNSVSRTKSGSIKLWSLRTWCSFYAHFTIWSY